MAEKRKKYPQLTAPLGIFRFPKLAEPDFGNKEFPKPDGEYSVQVLLPIDGAGAEFLKQLKPFIEEAKSEAAEKFKALPVGTRKKLGEPKENTQGSEDYDKETEEPTGNRIFKFAMRASGVVKEGPRKGKKWERNPVIFDAAGVRMDPVPSIWGGTKGKVAFTPSIYFIPGTGAFGVKLNLDAVQVIELVAGGAKSADGYGFGKEEGGYVHTPLPTSSDDAQQNTESTDDGSGDF